MADVQPPDIPVLSKSIYFLNAAFNNRIPAANKTMVRHRFWERGKEKGLAVVARGLLTVHADIMPVLPLRLACPQNVPNHVSHFAFLLRLRSNTHLLLPVHLETLGSHPRIGRGVYDIERLP
jgi:hypothetical protein